MQIQNQTAPIIPPSQKIQKAEQKTLQNNSPTLYKPSTLEVKNYYLTKFTNINKSEKKPKTFDNLITDIAQKKRKLETVEDFQKAYEIIAKDMGIEHPSKNNVKFESFKNTRYQGCVAILEDESGIIKINKETFQELTDLDKIQIITHETTHQKQFLVMHRYLGDENFAKLLSQSVEVTENYVPNIAELKKNNPQEYKKKIKETYPVLLKTVKTNELFQKNKTKPLTNDEKRKVASYIEGIWDYEYDKGEKYYNNYLEVEARSSEKYVEMVYGLNKKD